MNTLQARNETIINASVENIWAVITDIDALPKVNPGVIRASGRMDIQGGTRSCEIDNRGRRGRMVEKLVEIVPQRKTVWTIESDTMGMSKMLSDTRFVFNLEKISDDATKVVNETYYKPANLLAKVMNLLLIKRMIAKAQAQILQNIRLLTEKK
jgi:uncharacterized protein YndB with AHSA1/START domain